MAKTVDFKSTLNLPHTDFPMKAKLPEREPEQLADWERAGIYRRILESRAASPLFVPFGRQQTSSKKEECQQRRTLTPPA